jgi:hypothetical protein
MRGKCRLPEYLAKLDSLPDFTQEAAGAVTLYPAAYDHDGGATCRHCSQSYVVA